MCADLQKDLKNTNDFRSLAKIPRVILEQESTGVSRDELAHLRAWRWRPSEPVLLLDGTGVFRLARLRADGEIESIEREWRDDRADLVVATALPDRPAFKATVRQAAMIGCTTLHWFFSDHSRSSGARYDGADLERARAWVDETMKQAILARRMALILHASLDAVLESLLGQNPVALDPNGTALSVAHWGTASPLIGPEGGWSEREIAVFRDRNIPLVALPTPVLTVPFAVTTALAYVAIGRP